jgi:hypothetical protein
MNFSVFISYMLTLLQISGPSGTAAFNSMVSYFITYAENKMQRDPDLDFMATRAIDLSESTTGATRAVAIPSQFIIVEGANLITPSGALPSQPGATRIPLIRADKPWLDLIWPNETQVMPVDELNNFYYAIYSMQQPVQSEGSADEPAALPSTIIIAPTPDNIYKVEFSGTTRITPLSSTNATNFLSLYLPDMYVAAAMISACGYQRDFGAQSSNPQMAMSWAALYEDLKKSASVESLRQKALISGYSSLPPMPMMGPQELAAKAAAAG